MRDKMPFLAVIILHVGIHGTHVTAFIYFYRKQCLRIIRIESRNSSVLEFLELPTDKSEVPTGARDYSCYLTVQLD
jgi:hypothetical protein